MFSSKVVRLACVAAAGLSAGPFQPAKVGAAEVIIRRAPIVVPGPVVRVAPVAPVVTVAPVAPLVRVEPAVGVAPVYRPWYGFRWVR